MQIELFDTTLRDGTQGEYVNLSIQDKILITQKLDDFGIDIIEGGWPGSNPKDAEYFAKIKTIKLNHSQICAFGSTARSLNQVKEDQNLNALLFAETPYVSIFGKTWRLHSKNSLGLSDDENAELIYKSIEYLKSEGRKVIFDAEHFFDGFREDKYFAIRMLEAAQSAGADVITLCDTNGGTLPNDVATAIAKVKVFINKPLGIHAHNDSELAVANSITAVKNGVVHVQGTINGVGERCGNANLCSILPNLILKLQEKVNPKVDLSQLTKLSNFVYDIMNLVPNHRAAYVGQSAFAHKGGVHVSSVLKDSRMYEHIVPEKIGNSQRVIVSDLSGQSNIKYKVNELGINLIDKDVYKEVVENIKNLEYEGYQFDGAEASFELLLRKKLGEYKPFFNVEYAKSNVMFDGKNYDYSEAVLKIQVNDEVEHTASDGNGPVSALDNAMRKALLRFFPEIIETRLVDYKVRVLNGNNGTEAKVRVLIDSADGEDTWSTVGVSENIINASLQALSDSYNYKLFKQFKNKKEEIFH